MTSATPGMSGRAAAALGLVRLGFAAWMGGAPDRAARALGAPPDAGWARAGVRVMALRELVLGLGTLRSARRGGADRWVAAQAVADATDMALYLGLARRGDLDPQAARRAALAALSGVLGEGGAVLAARRRPD